MQTVLDRPEHVKEGIDAGAFYYLAKLTDPSLLLSIVKAAVSDFHQTKALLDKINESQNPFAHLVEGKFRFRTLNEGEYLALGIANACDAPDQVVAISELLNNAVEHGNLGITYDEKTKHIKEDTLYAEIERRLALPEYARKYVEIRFKKSRHQMTVLIKDQGRGFDFKKYLVLDESRVFHTHGRGIALANTFTDLQYLGTGNQVRMTIPFADK
jgi:anti-sigma regulatory factor (Ser/Thr protein kinase)